MSQSTVIVGYLIAGFVVFITVRGELPTYLGFLLGSGQGAQQTAANPSTPAAGSTTTNTANNAALGMSATTAMLALL